MAVVAQWAVLQPVTGVCGNTNLLPVAIFVPFWQVRAFLVSAANGVRVSLGDVMSIVA